MGLVTFVVPFGIIPTNIATNESGVAFTEPILFGLLWVYAPYLTGSPFLTLDLYFTWMTIPLSLFNLFYFIETVRYYQGKCTRYRAVSVGVLSIVLPTILSIATTGILTPFVIFMFVGPLPIQFVVGLIIMYRIPGPELPSAFSNEIEDLDRSIPDRAMVIDSLYSDSGNDEDKTVGNK